MRVPLPFRRIVIEVGGQRYETRSRRRAIQFMESYRRTYEMLHGPRETVFFAASRGKSCRGG